MLYKVLLEIFSNWLHCPSELNFLLEMRAANVSSLRLLPLFFGGKKKAKCQRIIIRKNQKHVLFTINSPPSSHSFLRSTFITHRRGTGFFDWFTTMLLHEQDSYLPPQYQLDEQ